MTQKKLAEIVAKLEGKKHQASIADIREIIRILVDLECKGKGISTLLARAAAKRKKK